MCVEFGILGPVKALRDGTALPVTSAKQRAVLAVLLLRANQVVTADELAQALWGSAQPSSARVTLQNYVKRLRCALGDAGQRILTQSPGYLIRVTAEEVDTGVFEANLLAARRARQAASWQLAADHARAALAVWRGEPLCDVRSEEISRHHVPRLLELRMETTEIAIEA
jgi:DNA-binding SARP family transcriptional activator